MSHSRKLFASTSLRAMGLAAAGVIVIGLSSTLALSEPIIEMSWNACSPIQHDRVLPAGETTSNLYISTTGMQLPHRAFWVNVLFATRTNCGPYGGVPDAWRFDVPGCQGTAFWNAYTTSTSKACPALNQGTESSRIVDMAYGQIVGIMRITVAVSYSPQVPDPNQRYQLARILFDHTYAVPGAGTPDWTCGGFEQPMCFTLWGGNDMRGTCQENTDARYVDAAGIEHYFQLAVPRDVNSFRIDPSIQACNLATPAQRSTWGSIKAQYR